MKTGDTRWELSKEQLDLIEAFQVDYNAIDRFLRKTLGSEVRVSFTDLLRQYSQKHVGSRDADLLRTIADVRNAIVHGKVEPYHYVAVPTPEIVDGLRACRDRLLSPARAIPKFQRIVESISIHDTLAQVLRVIKKRDYSQFPVYDDERFRGLLTENGITRWLAHHVTTRLSLVELEDVPIGEVLENEGKIKNYHFTARDTRVDDLIGQFASHELLEVVLITANGKESQSLLGIVTRWDIIHVA